MADVRPRVAVDGDGENDLEDEVMHETIAAGRGDRDEVGTRDQWSSSEHLRETSRFDTRKPISTKIQGVLRQYRLECDGCDHKEAVEKINAFVLNTKRQTEQRAQRQALFERRIVSVTVVVSLCILAFLYYKRVGKNNNGSTGNTLGGGRGDFDHRRRLEIDDQRRRAASRSEEEANVKQSPTWVDNERREVWTPKQEKQFAKALRSFGGVGPKERYQLISYEVDGKNKKECLMHHKLQQLIAKEQ